MNKENKKMAQEQRKAEREKEARNKKMKKVIPLVIAAIVVIVLIVGIVKTSKSDSASEDTAAASSTVTESTAETDLDEITAERDAKELDTTADVEVQDGDLINLDYTGYLGDEAFDGGSTMGMGTDLTIGSGMYIDSFEEQIIGHKVGETFDITVTFPSDYGSTELAGQEARFEITVNGIYH